MILSACVALGNAGEKFARQRKVEKRSALHVALAFIDWKLEEANKHQLEGCTMFGLLYGLFEQAFAKKEYYALILGLDNAGKTVRPPPTQTT